jgi:hypothetical protein
VFSACGRPLITLPWVKATITPPSHVIVPSVAMKASTPRRTTTTALIAPTTAASATAMMTASSSGVPCLVVNTPISAALPTITAATERSKSPARSGIVSARARIRMTACPESVTVRFVVVKYLPGSAIVKQTIRTRKTSTRP